MSLPPTFGQFTLGPNSGVYNLSDSTFSLTAPTSDSSGSFSYTSDNSAVAIIQSPSSSTTTSLLARYDASVASSYTLSGSNVTQWRDLTGNGYDLTPNGTGPTLATINTNNAFNFNNGRGLTRSSVPLASAITIFMVIKYSTNIMPYGGFMLHGNRDTDWSIERDGFNSKVIFESGNNNNVVVDVTNNTNYIFTSQIPSEIIKKFSRIFFYILTPISKEGTCLQEQTNSPSPRTSSIVISSNSSLQLYS